MTTLELQEFIDERPRTSGFIGNFLHVLASVKRWKDRRQMLVKLAHLDERLLRDIGLVPPEALGGLSVIEAVVSHRPRC